MKSIVKRLLPLAVIPFVTGCIYGSTKVIYDKTTSIMASSTITSTKIYLSVQKCDGEAKYQITLNEKTGLTINCNFWCDSGSVEIAVRALDDSLFFKLDITEDTNFDIDLYQYGKHYIILNHSAFKGKYNLTWSGK